MTDPRLAELQDQVNLLSRRVEAGEQALDLVKIPGAAVSGTLGAVEYPITTAGNANTAVAAVWTVLATTNFEDETYAVFDSSKIRIVQSGWYFCTLTIACVSTGTANIIVGGAPRVNSTPQRIQVVTNRTSGTAGGPVFASAGTLFNFQDGDLIDAATLRLGVAGVANEYLISTAPVSNIGLLFVRPDNV